MSTPNPGRLAAVDFGARAEQAVADALIADGWRVLARNWRAAGGEVDLIVVRDGKLRFVEVKARTEAVMDGADAITPDKQRRIAMAANAWLDAHVTDATELAMLVAVVDVVGGELTIRWIDDAFDAR